MLLRAMKLSKLATSVCAIKLTCCRFDLYYFSRRALGGVVIDDILAAVDQLLLCFTIKAK